MLAHLLERYRVAFLSHTCLLKRSLKAKWLDNALARLITLVSVRSFFLKEVLHDALAAKYGPSLD